MSRVYCPYCGMSYNINKSLIPEDNVKVRCRSCANVFILNKETGAIKNDDHTQEHDHKSISQTENDAEDKEKHTDGEDLAESMMEDTDDSQSQQETEEKEDIVKKKINVLQIITLAVLILILILASISALDYYKIINVPFISEWLSQFR